MSETKGHASYYNYRTFYLGRVLKLNGRTSITFAVLFYNNNIPEPRTSTGSREAGGLSSDNLAQERQEFSWPSRLHVVGPF